MIWSILRFGKHKGKSLPQVLFKDPDWFYWAMEKNAFNNKVYILDEANEIFHKSKRIRVLQKGTEKLVVEYAIHPSSKNFTGMEIVTVSHPKHVGSTKTIRERYIDMSFPRQLENYDKRGYKLFIKNLKYHLFGSKSYKMTKRRCEEFFNDDNNFDL